MLSIDHNASSGFRGEVTLARNDLSRLNAQLLGLPRWGMAVGIAVYALVCMSFGGLIGPGTSWPRTVMALVVLLILVPLVVLMTRRKLRSPLEGATLQIAVNDVGITISSQKARGTSKWSALRSYDLVDDGIALHTQNDSMQFIFLRAFEADDRDAIVAHVRARLPRSRRSRTRVYIQSAFWGAIAVGASLTLIRFMQ